MIFIVSKGFFKLIKNTVLKLLKKLFTIIRIILPKMSLHSVYAWLFKREQFPFESTNWTCVALVLRSFL